MNKLLLLVVSLTVAFATPQCDETEAPLTSIESSVFEGAYSYSAIDSRTFEPVKVKVQTKVTVEPIQYPELKVAVKLPKPQMIKTDIKCLKCEK